MRGKPRERQWTVCILLALRGQQHSTSAVQVPWKARSRSVHAIPGGYDEYLESLRWMATSIRGWRVARAEFEVAIMHYFSIRPSYASEIVKFLLKTKLIHVHSGACTLADVTELWVSSDDDADLIAQLHRKAQFIGEMLALLGDPMTVPELRHKACEQYSMPWESNQQINTMP